MEIQKIFSDMYDEERLYSVLLTEDEMNLYQSMFSDEEDEVEENPKKKMSGGKKAAIAAAGTGAAATGAVVGSKYAGKAVLKHAEKARNAAIEAGEFGGEAWKKNARKVKLGHGLQKPADAISGTAKKAVGRFRGMGKAGKIATAATAATAAGGGIAYAVKKNHDKKNK